MKVLLCRQNCNYFPLEVPPTITRRNYYPYNRIGDIIEHIEELSKGNIILLKEYTDKFLQERPDKVYKLQGVDNLYYLYSSSHRRVCVYKVEDVFTYQPWTICRNNDGEYIKYLDGDDENAFLYDAGLNYYKIGVI